MADKRRGPIARRRGDHRTGPEPAGDGGRGEGILVIGLGRFGGAMALTLAVGGHDVIGIDADEALVQRYMGELTHVVAADSTDIEALRQLGAGDVAHAVVGIGHVEASVLTTAALVDLDVPSIWARAVTDAHGTILARVGAHHVVFPERDMGERVAHLVTGRMIDYIALDDDFALVETRAPRDIVGKTLGESGVRRRYGITVVCIKPAGQSFTYATPETVIGADDILLVAGETRHAESFAEAT